MTAHAPKVLTPMQFLTFLQLQILRILNKPTVHAPGPKRPSLTQQDTGLHK